MLFTFEKNSKNTDLALLILRIVFGGFMAVRHGWPKFMKFFAEGPVQFADPLHVGAATSLGLTVFAELLCAVLIMLGVGTRWATIPLMITMFVAAFVIHWEDPFNKKEFALLYLFGYLVLLIAGAGRYSLDAFLNRKKI